MRSRAALVERLHAELDGARARRDRRECVGLRHARQGLRLRVSRRRASSRRGPRPSAAKARDVTEVLAELGLPPVVPGGRSADRRLSLRLLDAARPEGRAAAARVARRGRVRACKEIAEGHLCCGSAGTYNVLQPELAKRLRERKLAHIARTRAAVVATGNIGCITQLAAGAGVPVVHTVELLDWATGGPRPPALANFARRSRIECRRLERRYDDMIDPKQLLEQVLGSTAAR